MMRFLFLLFWELLQNLPLVAGFIVSFQFWQQGKLAIVITCMVISSVVAALVIRVTEPKIFAGNRESVHAVIANVVIFPVLMFVFVAYLAASWSSWWTDVAGGLVAAIALVAVQDPAPKKRFNIVRSLALGLSCSGSMILIRLSIETSILIAIAIVTVWFTLVMGVYKQLRLKAKRALHNSQPSHARLPKTNAS